MDQWETLHTTDEWYDGPREGYAEFEGDPCHYQSWWDAQKDDWAGEWRGREYLSYYHLVRVDSSTLSLALESWAIWCRWETAFHAGMATVETHPALAAERPRYDVLARLLKQVDLSGEKVQRAGKFRLHQDYENSDARPGGGYPMQVCWSLITGGDPEPPDDDD